jgi:hypothetical protein
MKLFIGALAGVILAYVLCSPVQHEVFDLVELSEFKFEVGQGTGCPGVTYGAGTSCTNITRSPSCVQAYMDLQAGDNSYTVNNCCVPGGGGLASCNVANDSSGTSSSGSFNFNNPPCPPTRKMTCSCTFWTSSCVSTDVQAPCDGTYKTLNSGC